MTIVVRPSHKRAQRHLDRLLGFGIERRSRLVQKDDRRVLQEGAGDGDALTLPARQLHAVLAAWRIIAALEAHDEIVRIGRLGRGDDLFLARARPAHRDVVAHRAFEQEILLRDIGDLPAHDVRLTVAMSCAVAEDLPGPDLVETHDEVHHRRFAAARAADQRRRLAGFGDEADRMQHGFPRPVAEHHVVELDLPVGHLELGRVRPILLVIAFVEEVVEHADAEQRRRQVDMQPRHPLHRLIEHDHRSDEGKEAPRRVAADDDGVAGIEHHGGDSEAAKALHDRAGARADARELVGRRLEASDRLLLPARA